MKKKKKKAESRTSEEKCAYDQIDKTCRMLPGFVRFELTKSEFSSSPAEHIVVTYKIVFIMTIKEGKKKDLKRIVSQMNEGNTTPHCCHTLYLIFILKKKIIQCHLDKEKEE